MAHRRYGCHGRVLAAPPSHLGVSGRPPPRGAAPCARLEPKAAVGALEAMEARELDKLFLLWGPIQFNEWVQLR